ncbi:MAG: multidrug effflux MFS transporter [Fimbriimonadaceae bacterium]|nr:multidrug effflux MFS transporter [Alphaproteobacteria bacterium]
MSAADYRPGVFLLIAYAAVSQIGGAMYTPSLPAMAEAFNAPIMTIQLTMTVYLIGYAVAQVVVGSLADSFGRRAVMQSGLALFTLASLAGAFAPNIETLIAIRLLQATGACAGLVVSRAIVRDCFDPAESGRYMAYLGMAMGLMPALSPMVGGQLQVWFGWYANFLGMALIGFGAYVASALLLQETLPLEQRRSMRRLGVLLSGYAVLLRKPEFLAYAFSLGIATAMFFVFLSGGPVVMISGYGVSPDVYGFYGLSMPSGFISGNYLSSHILRRIGLERAFVYGYALKLLACAIFMIGPVFGDFGAAGFLVPMVLIGFGAGLITPSGFAGVVRGDPAIAGTASGLSGFFQMAFAAGGTFVMGLIPHDTLRHYGMLQTALAILGIATFWLLIGFARRRDRMAS